MLKEQIEKLNELHGRLEEIRQIPPQLLHNRMGKGAENEFAVLKEIGDIALSEPVQTALHRARESLESDGSGIEAEHRRENRKRRRAGSPYVEGDRERTAQPASENVKMENVGEWARMYNETHTNKIRIRGRLVRLAMAEVMTVYMGIGVDGNGCVVVETIKAFGPREDTTGQGQSRYAVYQQLSQQLGKIVEGGGGGGLAGMAEIVGGYSDLFVRACRVCGRVVETEGHVPAVVRVWTAEGWAAEHGCVG